MIQTPGSSRGRTVWSSRQDSRPQIHVSTVSRFAVGHHWSNGPVALRYVVKGSLRQLMSKQVSNSFCPPREWAVIYTASLKRNGGPLWPRCVLQDKVLQGDFGAAARCFDNLTICRWPCMGTKPRRLCVRSLCSRPHWIIPELSSWCPSIS